MKTYNKILFLFLTGTFIFSSCTKQEEFVSSLYIVSFINPDESFRVQIQKTAPTLGDHSDLTIDNAIVIVENNTTQEIIKLSHQGDGIYMSSGNKPAPGYDYQIRVNAPGFPEAAATTYVPDLGDVAVNLNEVQAESNEVGFTFSPTIISDKTSNFFAYELVYNKPVEVDGGEETEEEPSNGGSVVNSENVGGAEEMINTLKPVMGSVSDGSSVSVQTVNTVDAEIEEISVRIVAVSSEFYDYLLEQSDNETYVSSSVLPKTFKVYSNFVGDAFGIFGGFNEKTIKLVQ